MNTGFKRFLIYSLAAAAALPATLAAGPIDSLMKFVSTQPDLLRMKFVLFLLVAGAFIAVTQVLNVGGRNGNKSRANTWLIIIALILAYAATALIPSNFVVYWFSQFAAIIEIILILGFILLIFYVARFIHKSHDHQTFRGIVIFVASGVMEIIIQGFQVTITQGLLVNSFSGSHFTIASLLDWFSWGATIGMIIGAIMAVLGIPQIPNKGLFSQPNRNFSVPERDTTNIPEGDLGNEHKRDANEKNDEKNLKKDDTILRRDEGREKHNFQIMNKEDIEEIKDLEKLNPFLLELTSFTNPAGIQNNWRRNNVEYFKHLINEINDADKWVLQIKTLFKKMKDPLGHLNHEILMDIGVFRKEAGLLQDIKNRIISDSDARRDGGQARIDTILKKLEHEHLLLRAQIKSTFDMMEKAIKYHEENVQNMIKLTNNIEDGLLELRHLIIQYIEFLESNPSNEDIAEHIQAYHDRIVTVYRKLNESASNAQTLIHNTGRIRQIDELIVHNLNSERIKMFRELRTESKSIHDLEHQMNKIEHDERELGGRGRPAA